MTDIEIVQAGTWPRYQISLTRSGYPLPLAGAIANLQGNHTLYSGWAFSKRCEVIANGVLLVTFDPDDTVHPGDYNVTLTLHYGDEVLTLPTEGAYLMSIGAAYEPVAVVKPELKIYEWTGSALSLKAVIDSYQYAEWTRQWRTYGEVSFTVNRHITGFDEIQTGRYVVLYRDGVYRVAKIETRESQLTETGEASEDWNISGREVGAILEYRNCLYGVSTGSGYDSQSAVAGETAMRHYVDMNAITTDTARVVPGLALELSDEEKGSDVTTSARFETVAEILKECCLQSGLGWRIEYEFSGNVWRFVVLEGSDLSASIVLSPRLGNALVASYHDSIANTPSVAIVAGQGDAAARSIQTVGSATGWDRREIFVDARDLDTSDALIARGQSKLEETGEETTLEMQYIQTPMYRYGTDFDLGDIIRGEYPDVATVTSRIVAVREEYPSGNVTLTLGTEWPDIISILKAQKKDDVVKRT